MSNQRLRWNGNIQAQKEADEAFKRLKDKNPKRKKASSKTKKTKVKCKYQYVDYHTYIKSEKWASKRKKIFKRAGYKCENCNSKDDLQVHHLTYKRLGRERLNDLTALCSNCHSKAHKILQK